MSDIDPVVFEFQARINGYLADVSRATRTVDQQLGLQEKRVQSLEREMRKSSEAMKGHIKGLAAGLAGAFTGRELVGLLDSFTRLQNNLRVAGVEGDKMKEVQDRLYSSALKYGVELEGLSSLYSSLTQASKELGASQSQIFTIADAVSASLKITGTSAAEAGGALQQLQQVFRGSKVQAEEYNSLIDGLYPLLEAAAAGSDRWAGSVGKLTADVKASKVTSAEFFQAILAGSEVLQDKAAKGALTLAGGITNLTSAMTVFFGEADKANGVSAALGYTFNALAKNLDTIIPALATVATLIGGKYVAGMVAASAATVAKTVADVRGAQVAAAYAAAQAEAAGMLGIEAAAAARATASVTTLSVAQGVAARASAGLLGVVGGPLGAATLALGAAIYVVANAATAAEAAEAQYADGQRIAENATSKAADAVSALATAHGKARQEAIAQAKAEAENVRQKLASARASLKLAEAEAVRQLGARPSNASPSGSPVGVISRGVRKLSDTLFPASAVTPAGEEANRKRGEIAGYIARLKELDAALAAPPSSGAAGGDTSKGGKRAKSSGPTAAETAQRFNDELASLAQQTLSAQQALTKSAEARAELELRSVEIARLRALDGIQSEKDYSAAQKERLTQQVEALAAAERERIAIEEKAQLEQEAQDLARERYSNERDALQVQADLADSQSERKRIAIDMVDLELRYQKALLEAVIASEATSAAERKRAEVALAGVNATAAGKRDAASRANETPLEAYRRRLNRSEGAVQDQIESYVVEELDQVRDGIRGAIEKKLGIKDPLISGLLNLLIENVIMKPLAEALGSASGGSGGGFLGAIASVATSLLSPRASGGYVNGGQMYRVNEGSSPGRVEGFIPQGAGHIVPLGKMNAMLPSRGGQKVFNITVDARNSVTPTGFAQELSANILRQAAHMDGQTAQAVVKAMPQRMGQYERDGF